jgi:hypothetical protein
MVFEVVFSSISALIGFIFGHVFARIKKYYYETKPSQKVWSLKADSDGTRVEIVVANTSNHYTIDHEEYAALGYIDAYMAAALVMFSLKDVYKGLAVDVSMEKVFDYKRIDRNVILIGGPVNNPLSKKFLAEIDIPFRFDGHDLIDDKRNKVYRSIITDNFIETDYSLIVGWQNPFSPGRRMNLICGCRAHGLYAGAKFLAEQYSDLQLSKSNYVAVLRSKGHSYQSIGKGELLSCDVFDEIKPG